MDKPKPAPPIVFLPLMRIPAPPEKATKYLPAVWKPTWMADGLLERAAIAGHDDWNGPGSWDEADDQRRDHWRSVARAIAAVLTEKPNG